MERDKGDAAFHRLQHVVAKEKGLVPHEALAHVAVKEAGYRRITLFECGNDLSWKIRRVVSRMAPETQCRSIWSGSPSLSGLSSNVTVCLARKALTCVISRCICTTKRALSL